MVRSRKVIAALFFARWVWVKRVHKLFDVEFHVIDKTFGKFLSDQALILVLSYKKKKEKKIERYNFISYCVNCIIRLILVPSLTHCCIMFRIFSFWLSSMSFKYISNFCMSKTLPFIWNQMFEIFTKFHRWKPLFRSLHTKMGLCYGE